MSHETLAQLIQQYGYLAILIGTFLEGETILILGGFAAHLGYLELPWVMVSAFTGSFVGDQLYFYLGRRYGPKILSRRDSWRLNAEKVYKHLHRHQNFLILSFRFFYGLRNVTPFAVGAAHISRLRFFALNLIGAVVWSITFAGVGFIFGEAVRLMLDDVKRYELYLLLALALAGMILWLSSIYRVRRRARNRRTQP